MECFESNKKYFLGKEETIGYELIVRIPKDTHVYREKYDVTEYAKCFSRYMELTHDHRNLLLVMNEIKSISIFCDWNE